jgi:hypothetical protein
MGEHDAMVRYLAGKSLFPFQLSGRDPGKLVRPRR